MTPPRLSARSCELSWISAMRTFSPHRRPRAGVSATASTSCARSRRSCSTIPTRVARGLEPRLRSLAFRALYLRCLGAPQLSELGSVLGRVPVDDQLGGRVAERTRYPAPYHVRWKDVGAGVHVQHLPPNSLARGKGWVCGSLAWNVFHSLPNQRRQSARLVYV